MKLFLLLALCQLINLTHSHRNMTLYGNISLGYYYVDVYVGTPPQKKYLIVDTGSRQTVMTCDPCEKCGTHLNRPFRFKESETFTLLNKNHTNFDWNCSVYDAEGTCSFNAKYLEGSSYSGYVIKDIILFQNELNSINNTSKSHLISCAIEETGEFATQAVDGIMGFGPYSELTKIESPTLLEVEFRDGRIDSKVFSICLGHNGGQLMVGDWNTALHLPGEKPIYLDASRVSWGSNYNVELLGIMVK